MVEAILYTGAELVLNWILSGFFTEFNAKFKAENT